MWSRDHGLEFILSRSRSLDLMAKVSVSRPEGPGLGLETWWPRSRSQDSMLGAYACITITVICSTFKRVHCHQLELMQLVLWSRDHGLETWVHSSSFCPGLGLETWSPRSWSQDPVARVLVSRPKKVLTTTLAIWRYHCATTIPCTLVGVATILAPLAAHIWMIFCVASFP